MFIIKHHNYPNSYLYIYKNYIKKKKKKKEQIIYYYIHYIYYIYYR